MKKTKITAVIMLILSVCISLVLVGCKCKEHVDANNDHKCDKCSEVVSECVDEDNDDKCDICGVSLGNIQAGGQSGEIFASTSEGYADSKVYTYHSAITGLSTLNWNPLTWEENTDSTVLGYVTTGFFDFVLNKDGNGYVIVPEMATTVPGTDGALYQDVTYLYEGKFGVKEGETSKAFRIYLNSAAKWSDGTAIKAEDYIYSLKQQLDPDMMNRRADSFYGGDFSIYGAKNYLYSKTAAVFTPVASKYESVEAAVADGKKVYVDTVNFWGAPATVTGNIDQQWAPYDSTEQVDNGKGPIAVNEMVTTYMSYLMDSYSQCLCFYEENTNVGYKWDDVGFLAGKDENGNEYLDMIIEKKLVNPEFYVPYYNSSTTLVKKDVYEKTLVYHYSDSTTSTGLSSKDASKTVTSITSIYNSGTDSSNWASYGPYNLVQYQLDKELRFERNLKWYGYSDGKHVGQYQTDNVVITVVAEAATQLLMFEQGKLEDYSLQAQDVATYGNSSQLLYSPETYTRKVSFLTDYNCLETEQAKTAGVNKTMLTVKEFRQALSLLIDREAYAKACTSGCNAGFGMFNNMYVIDVINGVPYRSTEAGMKVIVDLYGIEYGAGKTYATLQDAYEAVTGYDVAKAKELLNTAYTYGTTHDKYGNVVTAGSADAIYNGTDIVTIVFGKYGDTVTWNRYYQNLKTAWENGAVGTSFEGKIVIDSKTDPNYPDAFKAGTIDAIFSTWGGAQLNCLSTFSNVYCDDYTGGGNQYERGFDTSKVQLNVQLDLDGSLNYVEYTGSLKDWSDWLAGINENEIKSVDGSKKLGDYQDYGFDVLTTVFAAIEAKFLGEYVFTPVYYFFNTSLDSFRINEAVDEYVTLVGFGGIRYTTYNYDDASWTQYVSDQGGTLDYTK